MLNTTLKTMLVVLALSYPIHQTAKSSIVLQEPIIEDLTAEICAVQCELHNERLQLDVIPAGFGLFSYGHFINFKPVFPYSNKYFSNGCTGNNTHAQVHFCPQCRKAETWWQIKYALGMADPRGEFKKWRA